MTQTMNLSTTSINISQNISDDDTWSNLQCDWDTFSFEDVLMARKQSASEHVLSQRAHLEEIVIPEEYADALIDIKSDCVAKNDLYQQIVCDANNIKNTIEELRKDIESLTSDNRCLQKSIEKLEKEESRLVTEYKQQKTAYQKAIQKFSTHFDMNIEVTRRTETSVEASLKFRSPNNTTPINIVVDKNRRKIISIDSAGIPSKEEDSMCTTDNVPEMICTIREMIS